MYLHGLPRANIPRVGVILYRRTSSWSLDFEGSVSIEACRGSVTNLTDGVVQKYGFVSPYLGAFELDSKANSE